MKNFVTSAVDAFGDDVMTPEQKEEILAEANAVLFKTWKSKIQLQHIKPPPPPRKITDDVLEYDWSDVLAAGYSRAHEMYDRETTRHYEEVSQWEASFADGALQKGSKSK